MNVIDSSHTSNTALLISILILGIFIFIGSFLYYIVYRTSKIDSHITDLNKSTMSTTLSFALDSQNYSVKIDNLDGNHNIGDIIPIWIRLQNPNVVFLNQQYNTNIYVSMFIGVFLILSTLIYMGYLASHVGRPILVPPVEASLPQESPTAPLKRSSPPAGPQESPTSVEYSRSTIENSPIRSPYGFTSSEGGFEVQTKESPTNMYNRQKNLDDKIQNHNDVYIKFNKLSSQNYLF